MGTYKRSKIQLCHDRLIAHYLMLFVQSIDKNCLTAIQNDII